MTLPWVYIAGPMSADPYGGVGNAVRAAEELRLRGYVPVVPQLTAVWAMIGSSANYEGWMALDLEYIRRCDVVLRLPGVSEGADREVAFALRLAKRVVFDLLELPRIPWCP
jgi:hypothetical protein